MIAIKNVLVIAACLYLVVGLIPHGLASPSLEVAEKGSYVYWFSYTDEDGKNQVTLPVRFKGKDVELDVKPLGEKYSSARLYVMDKATGNTAIEDFAPTETEAEPVQLDADDFQYVRCVKLRIVSEDGKPLESALVTITDGMNTRMRAMVTPADAGTATLWDVATGEINVKVEANGLKKTLDSDITLPDERDTPDFALDIRVAGDVDTLPAAEKPSAEKEESAPSTPTSGQGSSRVLQGIAGILFLGVILAIIYAVARARAVTAESVLRKMGVQFPQDQSEQSEPAASQQAAVEIDPNVCQFCGQRKDVAGNCACTVVPGTAGVSPAQAGAGVPRLVGIQGAYAGRIFEIPGSTTVIGREAGNDVALVDDTTASRRHAVITAENNEYSIADQGSSNGTFVNGVKVAAQKLAPGDEIQIGETKFRFEA